ncbi:glycerol-3-phosphate dehydrogenase, putative, partial [Perkinsus marinus ATCC 50983]
MTRGNQRDKDRQRALARKDKMSKGGTSQIEANQKALGIICTVCRQQFMVTQKKSQLEQHILATRDGNKYYDEEVRMWVFDEEVDYKGEKRSLVDVINTHHENVKYLPGITLPDNVVAKADLKEAVVGADILIFVLPHQFLPKVLSQIRDSGLFRTIH